MEEQTRIGRLQHELQDGSTKINMESHHRDSKKSGTTGEKWELATAGRRPCKAEREQANNLLMWPSRYFSYAKRHKFIIADNQPQRDSTNPATWHTAPDPP